MAILRIPRSDDAAQFVLLNITPASPNSPTLNGKIQGTDGSSAFVLNLKPALAARARATKGACNEEEWSSILKTTLLEGLMPENVEITATVDGEQESQIVFRKTFAGGLKQRLGSLTLKGDENEEIELFEWCAALAIQSASQAKDLQTEKAKVVKLVKEMQDLVKAKEEAEKEVIGKCMRLVNSKKEKIQELQSRLSRYGKGDSPAHELMQVDEHAEEDATQSAKSGRGKADAKDKGKEKGVPANTTLPRRGKRAAPDPESEEEVEELSREGKDLDMDQNEEDVETDENMEGEDTPSDHSFEDEVPEVRTRGVSQSQSLSQTRRVSQKNTPPTIEKGQEKPHAINRAASYSQHQKKTTDKVNGSETESDDEL